MPQFKEGQEINKISQYITKVCDQIRFKRAHKNITVEISNHLEDQKNAYIKKGQSPEEAEQNAVLQMGDPVIVGQQLDMTHRPKTDWLVIAGVALCIGIGLILQFIISYYSGVTADPRYSSAFQMQLTGLPIGIVAFLISYFADYTLIVKKPVMLFGIVLAICVMIIWSGNMAAYGTHRHILYVAMLLSPLYGAVIYKYRGSGYFGILGLGSLAGIALTGFAYGRGYMGCFIFTISGLVMLTWAIARGWFAVKKWKAFLLIYVPTVMVGIYILFFSGPYFGIRWRGLGFPLLKSMEDPYGANYISFIVAECLSKAQFFGRGEGLFLNADIPSLETSIQTALPCWWSDYSLTYIIYRFGYIWAVLLVAVIALFLFKLLRITLKQTSQIGYMICLSVTIQFMLQSMFYILSNLGYIAAIVGPLPFITLGRISFIVNMFLIGLLLSVHRNGTIVSDGMIPKKSYKTINITIKI